MDRAARIGGLLFTVSLLTSVAPAQSFLVFDTWEPFDQTGLFVGAHDIQGGDNFVIVDPGVGFMWRIDSFKAKFSTDTAGLYTNISATVTFFRTARTAPGVLVLEHAFGSKTLALPDFNSTGVPSGLEYTITDINVALSAPPTEPGIGYGVLIQYAFNGPGDIVPDYVNRASLVPGSSSISGWYRDLDDDGVIGVNDWQVFDEWDDGNLRFELTATPVLIPEPASFFALLLPLGALAASRRRAKKQRT